MILLISYARVSMFFNFQNNNCEIKQSIKKVYYLFLHLLKWIFINLVCNLIFNQNINHSLLLVFLLHDN